MCYKCRVIYIYIYCIFVKIQRAKEMGGGSFVDVTAITSARPGVFVSEGELTVGCKSTAKFPEKLDFFSNL